MERGPRAQPLKLKDLRPSKFSKEVAPIDEVCNRFGKLFDKSINYNANILVQEFNKEVENKQKRMSKGLEGLDNASYKNIFDIDAEVQETKEVVKPLLRGFAGEWGENVVTLLAGFVSGAKQITVVLPTPEKPAVGPRKVPAKLIIDEVDLDTAEFEKFLDERAEFFARRTNESMREELFNQIEIGIEKGESLEKIKERVNSTIGKRKIEAEDFNATAIARTETSAINQFVNEQAFQQSGIEKHRWEVATPQDSACISVNKQIRDIGKKFSNKLVRPPVHPNCNCYTVPIK